MDSRVAPEVAVQRFAEQASAGSAGRHLLRAIHFGSTQGGNWHEESDIDVLVVATGDPSEVEGVLSDLGWQVLQETGWRIEPLVYCPEAWREASGFVQNVAREGKEVFAVSNEESGRRTAHDLVDLAGEYLEMAEHLDTVRHARGVVDLAYNAAELVAKGWLLSTGEPLPRTHNGVVTRFGMRVVREGHVSSELGRALNRALTRRNRARYDPHSQLLPDQGREVLDAARALVESWEQREAAQGD